MDVEFSLPTVIVAIRVTPSGGWSRARNYQACVQPDVKVKSARRHSIRSGRWRSRQPPLGPDRTAAAPGAAVISGKSDERVHLTATSPAHAHPASVSVEPGS